MLSEEMVQHYFREGYVLVRQLVPSALASEVASVAKGYLKDNISWQPTTFLHDNPRQDADLHRLLREPAVYETASQLLGSPARVYYGMLAIVRAGGGYGLPWHQDNMYSNILGGALNIFIALGDITADMANLHISPRSHLSGVQASTAAKSEIARGHREAVKDPENDTCLPDLKAGDACIFDRNLLHRSLRNTTDKHRFAYAAQYQADHAREADTGRLDPIRMRAVDLHRMLDGATGAA